MRRRSVLLLALLVSGCAVYEPPNLPAAQIATLSFEQKGKAGGVFSLGSVALEKIDGKSPSASTGLLRHRTPIAVVPGKHTIELSYVVGTSYGRTSLWFVAEAGATYVVRGGAVGYGFSLWVEEESTGKRTGGVKGSSDEPQ